MTTFTYLFDPLCGWCYGAAPGIAWLRAQPGVTLHYHPTGLFAGGGPLQPQMRGHILAADQRIAALTGQVFSRDYERLVLGDPAGRLDSAPATLALTVVEALQPGRGLDYLQALQRARWVAGQDITALPVLAGLAETEFGLAGRDCLAAMDDPVRKAAAESWSGEGRLLLARMGASGVPALLRHGPGGSLQVMPSQHLYQSPERLLAAPAA